ncbi:hypothetical protein [Sphingobium sp. YR768]|uniref:hypothetical protein n=1 Tax=Sphingobium sp. YR768 TaxID=1884365 RepID=UPI0008D5D852|nr:hypothetical protein [Sphingobium sp. YR768]SES01457.1 hypothetical protein SAMN05518866_1313 [Sphingobium sp. YR768]
MSGVLIIKPLPIAATPTVTGTGAANLLTVDPNEAWIAPSAASLTIDIDMGAAVTVDSFYLGYTNADAAATWAIQRGITLGGGLVTIKPSGAMRASDSDGPRHHCFARLAAPATSRFFRLILSQAGGQPLYAGALILGVAFEKHREFGEGRTPIDTGTRQDLPGGGFGIGEGVVKAQFAFTFADLTIAERNALWSIKKDRGLSRPVLLVEDADLATGMNDAIHYGVFERFQAYERVNPAYTRWAGSVIEWV